jgi:hypothetical protein
VLHQVIFKNTKSWVKLLAYILTTILANLVGFSGEENLMKLQNSKTERTGTI